MNPQYREQVRISVLRYCEEALPYGLSTGELLQMVRAEGFRTLTQEQVATELMYLKGKRLIEQKAKTISPENPMWTITAKGRDHRAKP